MSTIKEIEAAIEKLPDPQVNELASWLETFRQRRVGVQAEDWLKRAVGAAGTKATTAEIQALTRGEE
ncbi:MAG TPA: hypothetical protein VHY37_06485 [Tepidisphaeraceae bacterium]|jgi:hypothetical protein|nr:hypothetical protein [Tepidisphaeraceae bacterium]